MSSTTETAPTETFDSTEDAYNDSMGMDAATILVVDAEGVVGVSWAWPFSVTLRRGSLHSWNCDPRALGEGDDPPSAEVLRATEQAITLAKSKGYTLADWAL